MYVAVRLRERLMSTAQRELVFTIIRVLILYASIAAILLASLYLGLSEYTHFSFSATVKEMSEKAVKELEQLAQVVLSGGPLAIFWRNLLHLIAMATPFIGCGYALLAIFSTGFKAGLYIAVKNPEIAPILALALLSSPYAILELMSYALAIEAGIFLTYEILRNVSIRSRSLLIYVLKLGLSVALLHLAAVLEYDLAVTLAYS